MPNSRPTLEFCCIRAVNVNREQPPANLPNLQLSYGPCAGPSSTGMPRQHSRTHYSTGNIANAQHQTQDWTARLGLALVTVLLDDLH